MVYFTTLFDRHYAIKGLSLYHSLIKLNLNFHLYIYPFCEDSYKMLKELNLPNVTIISLEEFEDEKLLEVKKSRSFVEYCWTCTPSVIKYTIEKYNIPFCIYLDADIYFFSSPVEIINELLNYSIGITPHRFSKKYKKYEVNGIYNVQFMYFKNDKYGMEALNWWRERCIEWCYDRNEEGKFGDQKYLDDWEKRFKNLKIINDENIGVAPWNVQDYKYYIKNNRVYQTTRNAKNTKEVIFYHFHSFKIYKDGYVFIRGYKYSKDLIDTIYKLYIEEIINILTQYNEYKNVLMEGFISKNIESYLMFYALFLKKFFFYNNKNYLIIYDNNLFNKIKKEKISFIKIVISLFKKIKEKLINSS